MFLKPTRALKWIARGALLTSVLRRLLAFTDYGRKPAAPPAEG